MPEDESTYGKMYGILVIEKGTVTAGSSVFKDKKGAEERKRKLEKSNTSSTEYQVIEVWGFR